MSYNSPKLINRENKDMAIHYYEYYPHYMGTLSAAIKFTDAQFNKMIQLAKDMIKENKADEGSEMGPAYDAFEIFKYELEAKTGETLYALEDALVNYFDSPRRPSTIVNALKKKGVWADQWEEGSMAFATTAKKARKAVAAIEAKMVEDDF